MNKQTAARIVDDLGVIKAQQAELEKAAKALVAKLKAEGAGRYEGVLYEANLFEAERATVDWKAIAAKVGYSPQLLAAHTDRAVTLTLKVQARTGLAMAA